MFITLASCYSCSLQLVVSKSIFIVIVENFRKGRCITTHMERFLRGILKGWQGLQDQPLELGNPIMKISLHQVLVMRGMMGFQIHHLSHALTFYVMQGSLMISCSLCRGLV